MQSPVVGTGLVLSKKNKGKLRQVEIGVRSHVIHGLGLRLRYKDRHFCFEGDEKTLSLLNRVVKHHVTYGLKGSR